MDATDDRPPYTHAGLVEPLDPAKLWILGLGLDPDGRLIGPGLNRFSFWADCECPDDCNRDHDNE